jgi:hypothetical protein
LIEIQRHQRKSLADIIVKLPSNPGALLILRFDQSAANRGKGFFSDFVFGDVGASADVPCKSSISAESRHTFVTNPTILSVVPSQPILHSELFATIERLRVSVEASLQIVRVDTFHPTVSKLRVH